MPIADFLYIKLKILCKIITVILMEFAKIIILSVTAMVVLFLLTKLMGYRQINEMSFFDYVIGITIGSIAAEMSTNLDLEWWKGITAMAVWAIIGLLLSVITQKSIKARRFISGEPIIIMQKGKVIKKNLKKAKLDFGAFWQECEGEQCEDKRFFVMPVAEHRKSMEELKPSKRAQHRRRFAKMDEMESAVAESLKAYMR